MSAVGGDPRVAVLLVDDQPSRLLSYHVGLHPLLVFFAVLVGARVAGIWGAIFGVPIVAVVDADADLQSPELRRRLGVRCRW